MPVDATITFAATRQIGWQRLFRNTAAAAEHHGLLNAILPLAEASRAKLRGAVAVAAVAPQVPDERQALVACLETHLFRRLFAATSKTLVLELAVARRRGLLAGDTPEQRFAFFCECLADREFAARLLSQYPALARRTVILAAHWEQASREMLHRLGSDFSHIRTEMFGGEDPGPLTGAEPLGDSHAGGRCVHRLTFADGRKLIYKPRPVGMERGVQLFTRWLNEKGQTPVLSALVAIDREAYGWTQHRDAAPCASRAGVRRFFLRQGANLAIAHLLGGSDLHYENIIAVGEFPVIVDLETLFHDPPAAANLAPAGTAALALLGESVTRTLLLPVRVGGGVDISALGYVEGQEAPYVAHDWADWETDTMHMAERRGVLPAANCLPTFAGNAVSVLEHLRELADGFSDTYDLLIRHKRALLGSRGPLGAFRGRTIRKVFRPTSTYVQILAQSWHPSVAGEASALQKLLRQALPSADLPATERAAIRKTEFADLVNGDIPYFLARLGAKAVCKSERAAPVLPSAGWQACLERVKALSDTDKQRQLWITRLSFVDLNAGLPKSRWRARRVDRTALLAAATQVGDRLCDLAIVKDQRASWLFPILDDKVHLTPAVTGFDLYDGLAGIALFLGRLCTVTGNRRARKMTEAAVAEALDLLHLLRKDRACPGGFEGTGGLAYALANLGVLLERPDWWRQAVRIIATEAQHAAVNPDTDLISGRAGFLACGVAVATIASAPTLLQALAPCAEGLLSLQREQLPAVKNAGLAHGRAGIALALLRWSQATGRPAPAARAMLKSDLKASLQGAGGGRDMIAWCRGGVGTALAALRLGIDGGETVEQVVSAAMARVTGISGDYALCLCHGLFGVMDFLDEAARHGVHGAREGLCVVRREAVSRVLAGEFCSDHAHRLDAPGLMKGLAGTGYALLRLADPGVAPSVLTLESAAAVSGQQ